MDYQNIVKNIFAGTKYKTTEEDVKKLADNMAILEKRKLDKLNQRLVDGRRGIWSTIAEHNFAVMLVSQHCPTTSISYEPDIGLRRPPDFRVELRDVTYWIQMKDLSKLERENRQDNMIRQIQRAAKEIKVKKYFSCMLPDDFKEGCISELIDFMKDKAASAIEGDAFLFTSKNNQKAKIEFWSPTNVDLLHLTLGIAGDLVAVELTGQTKEQIKRSLLNAMGAFNWEIDDRNINLIAIEADADEDIDICDALFGTEYDEFSSDGHLGWSRKDDGLFGEADFSKKVAGVIAIKRTARKPVCDYNVILYMNDRFKHLFETIKRLGRIDKTVFDNMRPPMGHGNFNLS